MADLDLLYTWGEMWSAAQQINEYPDLDNRYHRIISKVNGNRCLDEIKDGFEFDTILRIHYRRDIVGKADEIKTRVEKRMLRGQLYHTELQNIENLKQASEENLEIEELRDLFFDLVEVGRSVNEKIYAERWSFTLFVLGIVIGYILGNIGPII
jgi:hypothetical protein